MPKSCCLPASCYMPVRMCLKPGLLHHRENLAGKRCLAFRVLSSTRDVISYSCLGAHGLLKLSCVGLHKWGGLRAWWPACTSAMALIEATNLLKIPASSKIPLAKSSNPGGIDLAESATSVMLQQSLPQPFQSEHPASGVRLLN